MTYPAGPGSQGVPKQYLGNGVWIPDTRYQGGGWYSYPDRGVQYSQAQLQKLWIDAGGAKSLAPVMAAIAEQKESSGWSGAWNSTGATGIWQIEWPNSAPKGWSRERLFNPADNAKAAVLLSGNSMAGVQSNWSGDFTNLKVPGYGPSQGLPTGPDITGPGTPGGVDTLSTAAAQTCLIGVNAHVPVLLFYTQTVNACILSKSQGRAVAGTAVSMSGWFLMLGGLAVLLAAGVNRAVAPVANTVAQVPGPGAGRAAAAIRARGRSGSSSSGRRAASSGRQPAAPKPAAPANPQPRSGTSPPPAPRPQNRPPAAPGGPSKSGTAPPRKRRP